MLSGIRAALGSASGDGLGYEQSASASRPFPERAQSPATDPPREELTNQFCSELEKVGGRAAHIESFTQLREYIERLLPEAESLEAHSSNVPGPHSAIDGRESPL